MKTLLAKNDMVIRGSPRDRLKGVELQIPFVTSFRRLRTIEQRTKMIDESERLGKTLINSLTHEIRTPISAIATAAAILNAARDPSLETVPWTMVDEIQEATRRLNRLVGSLLDMARLEPGYVKPRLDWCDLRDLVQVTLTGIEGEMAHQKVSIEIMNELPLVLMDFVLMQQVLTNLLLNTALHAPPGTSVQVLVRVKNSILTLSIEDDGPGIHPDALPFIFDKFYRAPSAPPGGTGLGLAIVKGFVEAHGGIVQAANRPEGGAVFTVYLPTKPPPILSA